jgi:hypothetical protein
LYVQKRTISFSRGPLRRALRAPPLPCPSTC